MTIDRAALIKAAEHHIKRGDSMQMDPKVVLKLAKGLDALDQLMSATNEFPISLDREGWNWQCVHCDGVGNNAMRSYQGHADDCELMLAIKAASEVLE